MRKKLEQLEEVRDTFTGVFERFGVKNGWKGLAEPTVLLKNIKNSKGKFMTEHLWFNLTKGFDSLGLEEGDLIQFDARVKSYVKGYRGFREDVYRPLEIDYKLSHPTKISILSKKNDSNT